MQGNAASIAWQPIKIRAEETGESFQFVQRVILFEYLGIQLQGRRSGVYTGTGTGIFFRLSTVGRRIGAEEKFRIAADGGLY